MSVRVTQTALLISAPAPSKVRVTQAAILISAGIPTVSITYPVSPPAISGLGPQEFTMSEVNVVGESESPFTLGQQIQQWPGQAWQLELNLPPMLLTQAEQWLAFLGSLLGKYGTFLMGDYLRPTPQGAMSGSPVANGSNSSQLNYINLRGCTPSIANWAVAGDYIQITVGSNPQRLYKVLQNASSDSSGDVTLQIFPNIRETIPDGTPIITSNCQGTFRLQDNTLKWKVDRNKVYTIGFKAKEAI